jgi:D-alanine-D-alanine ligase
MRRFGRQISRKIDVAFPIVHGTNVEDGALQGFFESLSIPFVGCNVTASAVGMDKYITKVLLRDSGIPVLDCRRIFVKSYFKDKESVISDIEGQISYPMIVKPLNLGSSIGIGKAVDAATLKDAMEYAFQYTDIALIERAISNLKEINCAVLGDRDSVIASECEEPISSDVILSYKDKYLSYGKNSAKGMATAKRKLPADISVKTRETVRDLAQRTFLALGCHGVARVDFLMDGTTDQLWVNEINTIPGSLSFYLWEPIGIPYCQLLDRLIELALKREREKASVSYSFETHILSNFMMHGVKGAKQ